MPDKPISKEELAAHFAVTPRTVENWMKMGIIPFWKIGKLVRFQLNKVEQALNERCGRNGPSAASDRTTRFGGAQ